MKSLSLATWFVLAAVAALTGCVSGYSWRSSVPKDLRTVSVPTFRNESEVAELGAVSARQVLREFQREGTFKIMNQGDAALEVQGVVKKASSASTAYSRTGGLRYASYLFTATVEVSVIDKRNGKVLIDNRVYTPSVSYTSGSDLMTAERDASGRLADELSRQVVDDILNLKW